jgi:hypothetical protein
MARAVSPAARLNAVAHHPCGTICLPAAAALPLSRWDSLNGNGRREGARFGI